MASLTELAVQGIVVVFGGTAGASALNAYFSRRTTRAAVSKTHAETGRTRAEITSVGAGTAAVQVDTAMDLLREMRTDMTTMRAEVTELNAWKIRHERRLDAHVKWDSQVWNVLQERGININPPPPLRDDPSD